MRRDNEKQLNAAQLEIQRWIFDMSFHGDYEKFRADMERTTAGMLGSEEQHGEFRMQISLLSNKHVIKTCMTDRLQSAAPVFFAYD